MPKILLLQVCIRYINRGIDYCLNKIQVELFTMIHIWRFPVSVALFGCIILLAALSPQAMAEGFFYWPGCRNPSEMPCGPDKACPSSAPYCTETVFPCDISGDYSPMIERRFICCGSKPDLNVCQGDDTQDFFKKFCACICKHRNSDPFLKENIDRFSCPDNL